jgi:hypothetical protein
MKLPPGLQVVLAAALKALIDRFLDRLDDGNLDTVLAPHQEQLHTQPPPVNPPSPRDFKERAEAPEEAQGPRPTEEASSPPEEDEDTQGQKVSPDPHRSPARDDDR